jgi:hypothetical protein
MKIGGHLEVTELPAGLADCDAVRGTKHRLDIWVERNVYLVGVGGRNTSIEVTF